MHGLGYIQQFYFHWEVQVTSNHIRKGSSKNYFQSKFIILIRYQQYILQKQCVLDVFFNTSITGTINEIVVEIWPVFFYYKKKVEVQFSEKFMLGAVMDSFVFHNWYCSMERKLGLENWINWLKIIPKGYSLAWKRGIGDCFAEI